MAQDCKHEEQNRYDRSYRRTQMEKEHIIQELKERGCRITKQRRMLLDIILEEECSCCKEIYYRAVRKDEKIGAATVYRMINMLEEIGAISRKNMYKVAYGTAYETEQGCTIELEDDTVIRLSAGKWKQIVQKGLSICGYTQGQAIRKIRMKD